MFPADIHDDDDVVAVAAAVVVVVVVAVVAVVAVTEESHAIIVHMIAPLAPHVHTLQPSGDLNVVPAGLLAHSVSGGGGHLKSASSTNPRGTQSWTATKNPAASGAVGAVDAA